ncbi:MAG: hypothetical protein JWM56_1256 [Candidatus Peribacteria bacterium]|nr:hypothetical protein [Candidatus Peribacteria bacterium]
MYDRLILEITKRPGILIGVMFGVAYSVVSTFVARDFALFLNLPAMILLVPLSGFLPLSELIGPHTGIIILAVFNATLFTILNGIFYKYMKSKRFILLDSIFCIILALPVLAMLPAILMLY